MATSWEFIKTFYAVAETGSLSAAARQLGLSQPTVGRHIDLLEQALNVPLFRRGREGMALTDRGAELVDSASQMLAAAHDFDRRAAGLSQTLSGVIRITANEIFGALVLPRLLTPLMDANPEIEVEIDVSNAAANLLRRDADIAVRMFRPSQVDLVARKVRDIPLGLFAHCDHIAGRPMPETLEDLRAFRFIGMDRDPSLIRATEMLGTPFARSDFALRCDSILSQFTAIRSGLGVGVTHVGIARQWPDVVQVLPDLPLPALELWIACHADIRYNPRVRLVMDFLATALRDPYRVWPETL